MKNSILATAAAILLLTQTACEKKEPKITGKINMAPALKQKLDSKAVLYVIARRAGETAGPPVAVRRFTQPLQFPIEFNLTSQDVMLPDVPFEGKFSITARVAQSGSATPIKSGDILGTAQPDTVEVGGGALKITLDQIKE